MRTLSEVEINTISQVLAQLRKAKSEMGLTCKKIVELTAEKGVPISDKTVRKVFSPASDATSFRLTTLFAIACAMGVDLVNAAANEEIARELSEREAKLAAAEEKLQAAENVVAMKDRQIEHLKAELETIQETSNDQANTIHQKDKTIRLVSHGLLFLLLALIVLLSFDVIDPHWMR